MSSAGVVEKLDVIEYLCPGFVACFVDLALDSLRLQQREEAFSHGVVMTVPPFNSTTDDGPASLPHQLPAADLEDNPNARIPPPRELMKKGLALYD